MLGSDHARGCRTHSSVNIYGGCKVHKLQMYTGAETHVCLLEHAQLQLLAHLKFALPSVLTRARFAL
jgi:hypothetical protein